MVATLRFFMFTPIFGEMIQIDEHIFQTGWFNHQLEKEAGGSLRFPPLFDRAFLLLNFGVVTMVIWGGALIHFRD